MDSWIHIDRHLSNVFYTYNLSFRWNSQICRSKCLPSSLVIWSRVKVWTLYTAFMMTAPNGNIFRVTGPLCGEFTSHRWIPLTKTSDVGLWCFLDLSLNKRLSNRSRRRWFETPSRWLLRHCNVENYPTVYTLAGWLAERARNPKADGIW